MRSYAVVLALATAVVGQLSEFSDGQPQQPTGVTTTIVPVVSESSEGQPEAPTSTGTVVIPGNSTLAVTTAAPTPASSAGAGASSAPAPISTAGAAIFDWSYGIAGLAGVGAIAALL